MHVGKIGNFEKLHKKAFPRFRALGDLEARELRGRVARRYNLPLEMDALELLLRLSETSREIAEVLEDDSLDVRRLLEGLGHRCSERVFLDWSRFSDVDELAEVDLSKYFSDIWYPSADDLGIFDETLDWMLFVQHWGAVFLCEPQMLRGCERRPVGLPG